MVSNKKFFIILVLLVVILLFGGASLYLFYRQSALKNKNTDSSNRVIDVSSVNTNANINTSPDVSVPETPLVNASVAENVESAPPVSTLSDEAQISQIARSFTERYGSFSNRNDFQNILSLKTYMTPSLQKWADNFVKEQKSQVRDNSLYYGVTTKTVSLDILEIKENKATVEVAAQRKETKEASGISNVFFQTIKLELKKLDNAWKVDSLTWL